MVISAYEYNQIPIDNLEFISTNDSNFYNYKGLNFLAKLKPQNNILVVNFHGAIKGFGTNRIIFRGYNYNIPNTDIVCISDYLLGIYEFYQVNWGLKTAKYDSDAIYCELFDFLIKSKLKIIPYGYKCVIFTGSSAGGYPSMYWACKFNQYAIISNPQIYLEKYGLAQKNSKNPWGFYQLAKLLSLDGDSICYEPNAMETHITKFKPKKIIIYNNKYDTHTLLNHTLPFAEFISKNNLSEYFDVNIFEGVEPPKDKTPHEVFFPNSKSHLKILTEFIEKIN